ncbi:MAG TPA: glycosyltransferase family 1 protein [Longimicrobiaceae bacterium]|nr:glycosyltransferase family 1 protein [Longimicrobiaceae bacterium]
MRVLLDISVLGLGHAFKELRGGTFRVHERLAEGLARSGECELLFCANYSSAAFAGCVEYLRSSRALGGLPLLGPPAASGGRLGRLTRAVHRPLRRLFPGGALPALLREGARLVDSRLHAQVRDASPPVDVLHSPGARLPPPVAAGRSPQRLLNIYDLAPMRLPALYGARQRHLAEARIAGLCGGDWVITTSESTRDDLAELAGVDPERVFVIPLAADRRTFHPGANPARVEELRRRLGIGAGPYLLVVGGPDVRKNVAAAVRAFTRTVREGGARDLSLVVAGSLLPGHGLREALGEAVRCDARVILAGFVPDEDLAALYGGALAFVYPSLYEGFGLPPLEAMQCGVPVIVARNSSLPEVVGDAGILVELDDPDALPGAMLRVFRDAALRDRLRALSLERAARFSWERFTRETLAAYRAITAGRS